MRHKAHLGLVFLFLSFGAWSLAAAESAVGGGGLKTPATSRKTDALSVGGVRRPVAVKADAESLPSAKFLARCLNQATGSDLRVNDPFPAPDAFTILVGKSKCAGIQALDFDHLHPYGYYIAKTDGDTLILAGKNASATGFAVCDFLKRFAGYRRFLPVDLGEILPAVDTVAIPATIFLKEEPTFTSYMILGFYGDDKGFFRYPRTTLLASHWLKRIYPPEKYGLEHPEYYCLIDGKRFIPTSKMEGTWQPCVSNPDLPRIAVDYAKNEWFPKHPEALGFSVGVNDGGGDCHCPRCTEWKNKYGNQYIPFYNAIARLAQKELPGKQVCFIVYGGAEGAPKNIQLEPNLYPEVCSGLRNNFEPMRDWSRSGVKDIGLYDYMYGMGYVVPRYYPHLVGNAWKTAYREYNLRGAWTEWLGQVWLFDGPREYVLSELAWNINADIDALLDDYFRSFYGEAAVPMRCFFDRIENIYGRAKDPFLINAGWQGVTQFADYTRADLAYLEAQLAEAKRCARTAPVARRVALFDKIFGLSRLYLEGFFASQDLKKAADGQEEPDPGRVLDTAAAGLRAVRGIDSYAISEDEQKDIFTNTSLNKYRSISTTKVEPFVQAEADRAFALITGRKEKEQGWLKTRDYWTSTADLPAYEMIRPIMLSQIFERESPEAKINLLTNGGFEPAEGTPDEVFSDTDLHRYSWDRVDRRLAGWAVWHFQQSVTRFYWDPAVAHTGKRSFSVRENQISGCFQTRVAVKPGCRYRVSFWVRQVPPERGGLFTIRWQNARGWADEAGANPAPRILLPYPTGKTVGWRKMETTFVAPDNVTGCVPLLLAPRQSAEEGIWFDDASMVKIYDPAFFAATHK